jgi:hypothetical protein
VSTGADGISVDCKPVDSRPEILPKNKMHFLIEKLFSLNPEQGLHLLHTTTKVRWCEAFG